MKHLFISLILAFAALNISAQTPKYLDGNAPVEERVKDALSRMTTHEKISILHAHGKFYSGGVPRLGIRGLWHSDGPHGVRAEVDWNAWDPAHWTTDSCVAFPSLTTLSATWNPDLARLYGASIAEEFAFRGKDILLGPGVNIMRNPLCGRNFEYMGEDPLVAGVMAVPYIQGAQATGVACCLKHFFLNNQEVDRMGVNVNVSERALHEIYLPAFKRCVEQSGLWTIMGSYNRWLNTHCCHNDSLLNGILKRAWGFDGAVVSDWGGTHDTMEAALGGLDIEMGTFTDGKTSDQSLGWHTYYLANAFENLINEGKIPMSVLDDKAARVLRTIFRTSMNPRKIIGSLCSEAHYDACHRIGREGIVLMKNNGILPIQAANYQRILVVGENATRDLHYGGGSSELKTLRDISPLEALRAEYGDRVSYAQGYYSGEALYARQEALDPVRQKALHDEALEKARQADLIIYIGGLNKNGHQDCEDSDRDDFNLSFGQNELIADLAAINPNIVICCIGGTPYATPWSDKVAAFVHSGYLGSMVGVSLTDVLSGKVNPSGKLTVTFAHRQSDYPCFAYGKIGYPGIDHQVNYDEGIYVGYRHFVTRGVKAAFPFGHGLSYTSFTYGKPEVAYNADGSYSITLDITNTGARDGAEVVQLYIGDDKCSVDRPKMELKGFTKLYLKAGETQQARFLITPDDLKFYSEQHHAFISEPGTFRAYIAASVQDVRQVVKFKL
ncbi:MAG: glycoside hydrolase family 3 C-terminal domain-containing protein [Bacteroidaceae bacterium]|nr:glycoside hydrolase family 3 C-terminal domain-containing protein [Bacteroidaceae bacterium]